MEVDTPDGRVVKQEVTGVFAGTVFDPNEVVKLKDETQRGLAAYANRLNIYLLKA
jgi:hypothetical protein